MPVLLMVLLFVALAAVLLGGFGLLPIVVIAIALFFGVRLLVRGARGKTPTP